MKPIEAHLQNKPALTQQEKKSQEAKQLEKKEEQKEASHVLSLNETKQSETKSEIGESSVDSVKKMLEDSIQWREMRFYRHQKDGKMYVDIVDRNSGEVIRTIPEPDFQTLAKQFQRRAGTTLDING